MAEEPATMRFRLQGSLISFSNSHFHLMETRQELRFIILRLAYSIQLILDECRSRFPKQFKVAFIQISYPRQNYTLIPCGQWQVYATINLLFHGSCRPVLVSNRIVKRCRAASALPSILFALVLI